MTTDIIAEFERSVLLADGAMGTELHRRGVAVGECFDALNLSNPDLVQNVHRDYIAAGADLIEANTFGTNRYQLGKHGLAKSVEEINRAAVERARQVIAVADRPVWLAASVGPLGVRMMPYGRLHPDEARAAFSEQIQALAAAKVDLLMLETFGDLRELSVAVAAARDVAVDVPVIASLSFAGDDHTLMGDSPEHAARELVALGVAGIGLNCSSGPEQLLQLLRAVRVPASDCLLSVMPNAGWPEQSGGRTMYAATPEYFAGYARAFAKSGARLIGGCCGTTAHHIRAMRAALDEGDVRSVPVSVQTFTQTDEIRPSVREQPTALAQKLAGDDFIVSVEMSPPRGYMPHKVLAGARMLAEAGADVINVADAPLARMRMSAWAVAYLLQRDVGAESVLHFPTRGRNLLRVQGDLLAAHALGVRNLFVIMGDPTSIGDYPQAMDTYDLAPSALIELIKRRFNSGRDHAGQLLGEPTHFVVGCALNMCARDLERELRVLRRKIRSGADFALTQPVYSAQSVRDFMQRFHSTDGEEILPVMVGVLPLYSERHARFLHNEVPGMEIPVDLMERMASASDAPAEGVRIAMELMAELRKTMGVRGVYLVPPFGRYEIAAEIMQAFDR